MLSRSPRELGRALYTTVFIGATITAVLAPGAVALAASAPPADTIDAVDYAPLPTGFTAWSDVFAEQDRLDAVAEQIRAARNEPGYSGIYVSPVKHRVDVYWHGPVPSRVVTPTIVAQRSPLGASVSVPRRPSLHTTRTVRGPIRTTLILGAGLAEAVIAIDKLGEVRHRNFG